MFCFAEVDLINVRVTKKLDTVETSFDALVTRLVTMEGEMSEIDERLKRLEQHCRITTAVPQTLRITSQNERLADDDYISA